MTQCPIPSVRRARRALSRRRRRVCCRGIQRCLPVPSYHARSPSWSNRGTPVGLPRAGGGSVRLGPGAKPPAAAVLRHLGLTRSRDLARRTRFGSTVYVERPHPSAGLPSAPRRSTRRAWSSSSGATAGRVPARAASTRSPTPWRSIRRRPAWPTATRVQASRISWASSRHRGGLPLVPRRRERRGWLHAAKSAGPVKIRAALSHALRTRRRGAPPSQQQLAGSPPALETSAQPRPSQLLGSVPALAAPGLRALRGRPRSCSTCGRRGARLAARSSPCSRTRPGTLWASGRVPWRRRRRTRRRTSRSFLASHRVSLSPATPRRATERSARSRRSRA